MKGKRNVLLWSALAIVVVIFFAFMLFFESNAMVTWALLNYPFQKQWTVVQLSDGEILYGHLFGVSGETIGLRDVYLLDKVTAAPTLDPLATSTDFMIGNTPNIVPPPQFIPVSDAGLLFVNRAAVIYFKFLPTNDPAMPYLK